jgi:hypothetical protein
MIGHPQVTDELEVSSANQASVPLNEMDISAWFNWESFIADLDDA